MKMNSHPSDEELADLRLERIREYQAQSLTNADPLHANIGAASGSLMQMGFRLEQAIEASLAESTDVLQQTKRLSDAMDTYLRITRQWDRLVQLNKRMAEGERRGQRQRHEKDTFDREREENTL